MQILDPRIDPRHWDLVVAPAHDGLRGDNVVPVLGSLNPVDDAWLADAADRFPAVLALPRPRVALLVGGPTRHVPWSAARMREAAAALRQQVLAGGGSLLATVSRRTPVEVREGLRDQLRGLPGLFWAGDGANPYPALLAAADRLVCTPDSVNMVSEACATPRRSSPWTRTAPAAASPASCRPWSKTVGSASSMADWMPSRSRR